MKYTTEVIINKPLGEVIKKLDDPENMKHWQKGLIDYTLLNPDDPRKAGAQMELRYQMGKRDVTMTETITKYDLPSEFHATYDAKGVHNIQNNYFHEIDANTTRWVSESEFKFKGVAMKLMGIVMPKVFKKQSQKYLDDFKNFVENDVSVSESK
jgi:mRNA-degrading endonuclease HigB of HigAB toxin-antitoxin module